MAENNNSSSKNIERVPSGIPGFDDLIEGGFPKGSQILVEGKAGTGKTIFAMQYLYNGATKFGEKGLYLTFEQKDESLKKQALQFGWDLDKAGVDVVFFSPSRIESVEQILRIIYDKHAKNGIKRLVIDSLPALYINANNIGPKQKLEGGVDLIINAFSNKKDFREVAKNFTCREKNEDKLEGKNFLYLLLDALKFFSLTTMIITEEAEGHNPDLEYTPQYISDGVIKISLEPIGNYSRNLLVMKMRHTKNNTNSQPLEIGPEGVVLHKLE